MINKEKIFLSYNNIRIIGYDIPQMYLGITKLYLSNNFIYTLTGIECFHSLTHLSISYNKIERIEELLKIKNPNILINLSVKGNLFCRNPSVNVLIVNMFKNLKELDGIKISESTFKTIDEGKEISELILPFLIKMNDKIDKINNFYNLLMINLEFHSNSINQEMLNNFIKLLSLVDIISINKFKLEKYLKGNINPSVHIVKKLIFSVFKENEFKTEQTIDRINLFKIFESLFEEIIQIYELKKNTSSLPFFLNYLILNSNSSILQFFISKTYIKDQKMDPFNALVETCNELENYFNKYTNHPSIFNSLRLLFFTKISPSEVEINSNKKLNIINNNKQEFLKTEKVKNFSINPNSNKYVNPFMKSVQNKCDINPFRPKKIEFVKEKIDYENSNFDSLYFDLFYEDGIEKINIDQLKEKTHLNLQNMPILAFPIFALNFDYMRVLMSLLQNKVNAYLTVYDEIYKIINKVNKQCEDKMKLIKLNKKKKEFKNKIQLNTKFDELFPNLKYCKENEEVLLKDNLFSNDGCNSYKEKSFEDKTIVKEYEFSKQSISDNSSNKKEYSIVKSNSVMNEINKRRLVLEREQKIMKILSNLIKYLEHKIKMQSFPILIEKIFDVSKEKGTKILTNLKYSNIKSYAFYELLRINNIDIFTKDRILGYKNSLVNKGFKILKYFYYLNKISKTRRIKSLKVKLFKTLQFKYFTKKTKKSNNNKARLFYIKTLLNKLFKTLKFNLFLSNKEQQEEKMIDESLSKSKTLTLTEHEQDDLEEDASQINESANLDNLIKSLEIKLNLSENSSSKNNFYAKKQDNPTQTKQIKHKYKVTNH